MERTLRLARFTGRAQETPMAEPSDNILTIDALAEYLKISRSTLYKLVQDGKLPGQKVGKRWRFHKEAIDEWLKQHPEKGAKQ
jgi:excisionase family DNA binding protein